MIDIILYLARQGLALRGHNEKQESSNRGNFLELCELFCKFDNNFSIKYCNNTKIKKRKRIII